VFVVKMQHGVFGNFGNSRIAQMTLADATIKIFLSFVRFSRSSSIFSKCSTPRVVKPAWNRQDET